MKPQHAFFDIEWSALWRISVFILLAILLYLIRDILGVLFFAIVISLALDPFVGFLEKRKIPRILGVLLVFIASLLILSTVFYFVIPVIADEIGGFLDQFNESTSSLLGFSLPESAIEGFSLNIDRALNFLSTSNFSVGGAVSSVFSSFILVIATIIISFYLMIEKNGAERFLEALLPDSYEKPVLKIFRGFKVKIRLWVLAQLGLSIVVGIVTAVGLWLLGVRYSLILGLLAALFELVPMIGPILAGLVAFLVAVSDSFALGFYVILLFFLIQQLESHLLAPIIIGKTMKVHPIVVIIALLAGAKLAGFVGILLAVPIAVIIQEIFMYLSDRKAHRHRHDLGI